MIWAAFVWFVFCTISESDTRTLKVLLARLRCSEELIFPVEYPKGTQTGTDLINIVYNVPPLKFTKLPTAIINYAHGNMKNVAFDAYLIK